jgi:hypothetical protein
VELFENFGSLASPRPRCHLRISSEHKFLIAHSIDQRLNCPTRLSRGEEYQIVLLPLLLDPLQRLLRVLISAIETVGEGQVVTEIPIKVLSVGLVCLGRSLSDGSEPRVLLKALNWDIEARFSRRRNQACMQCAKCFP